MALLIQSAQQRANSQDNLKIDHLKGEPHMNFED